MSFSQNIKNEILSYKIENQCCKLAFLTGLIKTISELNLSNGKINLEFKTDNRKLFEYSIMQFNNLGLNILDLSLDLHKDKEDVITTEYEDKFSSLGQVIYYIRIKEDK